jgi:ATP-binding protein involved in chromosome partitioning
VGLLDADLYGPSVAKMLGLRGQPVRLRAGRAEASGRDADDVLFPAPGPAGLRVQSMDFFLQGREPLDWEGDEAGSGLRSLMEQAALTDLLGRTAWEELDTLVVDLAPGVDRLPALVRWLPPRAAALAVTIPTEVSMLAVERSLRRAHAMRFPMIGLVENFSGAVCVACGCETPLYREAHVEERARRLALDVVARIPFDPKLAAAADDGCSFLEGPTLATPAARALCDLAEIVAGHRQFGRDGESW